MNNPKIAVANNYIGVDQGKQSFCFKLPNKQCYGTGLVTFGAQGSDFTIVLHNNNQ